MSILDRSPIAAARRALETNPDVVAAAADAARSTEGIVLAWKAATAYSAGQRVIAPNGDVVSAKVAFTSGASYSAADWDASSHIAEAKSYTDAGLLLDRSRLTSLEAVSPKVSNIALDTDGNPYYSPGSTQVHVIQDGDGEPYYITFLQASADEDGAPYF